MTATLMAACERCDEKFKVRDAKNAFGDDENVSLTYWKKDDQLWVHELKCPNCDHRGDMKVEIVITEEDN